MIKSWLKNWRGQVTLLVLSPIPLAVVLLITESYLHPDETLPYIAVIWSIVAFMAVIISGALALMAFGSYSFARRTYPREDPSRLIATVNFIVASGFVTVHTIFLAVGIATVLFEESFARQVFSRIGLVDAQYILLVTGIISYIIHKKIRERVDRKIPQGVEAKLDEAAEVATERHVQYTEEHYQMLKEARDAALKAAALAEALHKRE